MVEDVFHGHFFIIDGIVINDNSTMQDVLNHLSIGASGQVNKTSKVKLD